MIKKETVTTAATVTIGFSIAFLIVGTSQTFQSCIGEHYQHEPSETLQKGFAQLLVMSKVGSGCFGEFVHKNAEAIIALFTIILGIATWLLWRATKRLVEGADENAGKQLRPYVFLAAGEITDPMGTPKIKIKIKNFGQTPAYEMIFWTCGILREHPLASPLVRTASSALVPKMDIGPTGVIETEIRWDGPISEENRRLFAERKIALYFFGKIDYRDAFANSWYTEFRLVNGGECDPLMSNGSMAHAQEGNKAT